MPLIKICGLSTAETLDAALDAGADMVGFVFVPKSPRNISLAAAAELAARARRRAEIVALLVDPDNEAVEAVLSVVKPDLLQLHGQESGERVAAIRGGFDIPVIKAIGMSTREDVRRVYDYATLTDRILLDAKPPKNADYPGGHGQAFDWSILDAIDPPFPFMLSGGLTPETVADAIEQVRPWAVDVSSGVETAPGVKDVNRIAAFIAAVREAGIRYDRWTREGQPI